MKTFLSKTFLVAMIAFMIVFAIIFVSQYTIQKTSFSLPDNKHIVILGDSHTECAIDDSIFSSSVNLSQSGTGYLYSYILLNKLLETNNQIDTVILSFFDRSLSQEYDSILYTNERYYYKLPSFISLMSFEDIRTTNQSLATIVQAYINSSKYGFKQIIGSGDYRTLNVGGYLYLERNKLQTDIDRIKNTTPTKRELSANTKQYETLMKIKALCDNNKITLILMNTPTYMVDRLTDRASFDHQRNTLLNMFEYVDYSDFQLQDSCYGDVTHLNHYGAAIFSNYLQKNGIKQTNKPI